MIDTKPKAEVSLLPSFIVWLLEEGQHLMDQAVIQAFVRLNARHPTSADDILIDPNLRSQFLELARQTAATLDEKQALRCLLNLRKRSKLPRSR
jgi:hypothetical protein